MLLALSKFLPRVFHKKAAGGVAKAPGGSGEDGTPDGPGGQSSIRVILLDDTEIFVDVKPHSKSRVVLEPVFEYLNLVERQFFGLRYTDCETQQTLWLDPGKSVTSQLLCSLGLQIYIGASPEEIIRFYSPPPHTLYFGVKFYSADPCKLTEEITRYQMFLQVKADIVEGRLPVRPELGPELAAYAIQSELGDYNPARHPPGYVSEFQFCPNQTLEFEQRAADIHRSLHGMVPSRAEYVYLDKVKWLDMYGVDLHPVQGEGGLEYFLGLTPTGVVMYKNMKKVGNYFWPRLTKVTYKAKMFVIRVRDKHNEECTYQFECGTKQACKALYRCSVEHYSFFRETSASHSYQATGKLFSLSSKHRYSVRLEKRTSSDSLSRAQPVVVRRSSRRPDRRLSGSESCPEGFTPRQSSTSLLEPISRHQRRRDGYSSGPECSPTRSLAAPSRPWEPEGGRGHRRGAEIATWDQRCAGGATACYGGHDSPTSVHSEFPPRRRRVGGGGAAPSGSESDASTLVSRHRCRGDPSDTEGEFVPRHRRYAGTESESEFSCHGGGGHHRHHHHHHGGGEGRHRHRHEGADLSGLGGGSCWTYDGSMSSMTSEHSSHRRHRRRSQSPGVRPPDALAQHFKYVDPMEEGLSEDQLRDIPYTRVQTNTALRVKFSPRTRHRHRQQRQRSCGELNYSKPHLPDGEAPPPYNNEPMVSGDVYFLVPPDQRTDARLRLIGPPMADLTGQSGALNARRTPSYYRREDPGGAVQFLIHPASVHVKAANAAPVVRTKPVDGGHDLTHLSSRGFVDPITIANRSSIRSQPDSWQSSLNQPITQQQASMDDPHATMHVREDSGLDVDSPGSRSYDTIGQWPDQSYWTLSPFKSLSTRAAGSSPPPRGGANGPAIAEIRPLQRGGSPPVHRSPPGRRGAMERDRGRRLAPPDYRPRGSEADYRSIMRSSAYIEEAMYDSEWRDPGNVDAPLPNPRRSFVSLQRGPPPDSLRGASRLHRQPVSNSATGGPPRLSGYVSDFSGRPQQQRYRQITEL